MTTSYKIYVPFLLVLPYALLLLLYAFGPVSFSQLSAVTFSIVVLGASLFLLFLNIGAKTVRLSGGAIPRRDQFVISWYTFASPIILLSSAFLVFWIHSKGGSLDMVLTETGEVREITRGTDPAKQIAALFAYQAYGYIPIMATKWRERFPKYVNLIMLIAIFLMAWAVVLQAGRTFFLVVPALIYAAYVASPRILRKQFKSDIFLLFLGGGLFLAGSFVVYIIGVQRVSVLEITNTLQSSEYRYLKSFFESLDDRNAYFFTVVFHYLVGPWSNFNIAILSEAGFARWSFGPLEAVFSRFIDMSAWPVSASRAESLNNYAQLGGQLTGWRTGFGNVLIWYSFSGLAIFVPALGFIVGRTYRLSQTTSSIFFFLRATWILAFFFMCLYYFPSNSIFWVNIVFLFFVVPLFSRIRWSWCPRR